MKNFIFISPNFPANYWRFCRALKNDGWRVLGIGDQPYEELLPELKDSLQEYYKVSNLENYDEVFRAVAFFTFMYGKIDYLESNNEYWLERDALLRTEFNITTGFQKTDVKKIKYKSQMKRYYKKAGVKTAKHCQAKKLETCQKLIKEVGYPVIVKPDNGVGASDTHKINNEEELALFLKHRNKKVAYVMEEYINGEICSYDAIIDSKGNPVFETGNITPESLMDVVNNGDTSTFYIVNELAEDIRKLGRKTVKAFKVKSRFIHFEFFRLLSDQRIGKKGEVVALEVNMRPAGGIAPDMMNYANSTDVYRIWADVITEDKSSVEIGEKFFCAFAGRRDGREYRYHEQDIIDKYGYAIKIIDRVPQVLSNTMGNLMYVARFKTEEELKNFYNDVAELK